MAKFSRALITNEDAYKYIAILFVYLYNLKINFPYFQTWLILLEMEGEEEGVDHVQVVEEEETTEGNVNAHQKDKHFNQKKLFKRPKISFKIK